jgi:transcription initiation factor TFIIB
VGIDQIITKLAGIARLDAKLERLAIEIGHKSNNHILAKSPNGLAAAYMYLAAILLGVNLSQIDLPNMVGVTEVTVRSRCNDILIGFKLTIKVRPL